MRLSVMSLLSQIMGVLSDAEILGSKEPDCRTFNQNSDFPGLICIILNPSYLDVSNPSTPPLPQHQIVVKHSSLSDPPQQMEFQFLELPIA